MKYLVTGAAGFIGSALSERLLELDHEVVGLDAITNYYDPLLKQANLARLHRFSGFQFEQAEIGAMDLDSVLDDVEVVFHQAGQPGVRKSWGREFRRYTHANVDATQQLLEAAARSNTVRRLVYASSSSIYGEAETFPTKETDVPRPISPYGVTKLAGEHLVSLYGRSENLSTVSLRYFTVYGPGQRPDMAFTRFIKAILRGEEITIFGNGEQIRDFTFVQDVVEANLAAANARVKSGRVFNIAGGSSVTVNEVIQVLERVSGRRANVRRLPNVAGDVFRTGADTRLALDELRWTARTVLEEGLRAQFEWLEEAEERQEGDLAVDVGVA